MRLAILSDFHLGYAWGTERQEDSFIQAKEALDAASSSDVLLVAGDLFDSRVPRPEVFARALRFFTNHGSAGSGVSVSFFPREVSFGPRPVVTIFGTHERRGKGLVNPVQALEYAGFLVCLHCEAILLEKDGERVAIHGMSGVPEQFSKAALAEWGPKPIPGCTNILMLHQNLREYVFSDPSSLALADLPPGFDLIVSGHIHWSDTMELQNGSRLLLAGSTICTQQRKSEAGPKRVFFFDTSSKSISSVDLKSPRSLLLESLSFSDASPSDVLASAERLVKELSSHQYPKPPLVRLVLKGSLSKEYTRSDVDVSSLYSLAQGKLILSVEKSLDSEKLSVQRKALDELRANKLSIEELGMKLLESNLSSNGFMPAADLFSLLVEGNTNEVMSHLKGEK